MVGERILGDYRVIDHHARVPEEQQYRGVTSRNTPVYIDREYCESDLKLTTGFIEPHLMAGFSGGRKLVAPGCAGELTIKALHSPLFLENPACCEGSIDNNPLHHELLEIARKAGHDFIVNVSLDVNGAITGMFAGDPEIAHAKGIDFVRESVKAIAPRQADIVITTSAGYPLDLTYYQSVKGITAALPVVKRGGMLIVAAKCEEGLGSPEFTSMATAYRTVDAFVGTITANPVIIDQWQLEECAKAARQADVVLVSPNVAARFGHDLFIRTASSVEEALEDGFRKFGPDASISVIPKGPYTLVGVE
jgi:nickel-dependent lactate racemase